MKKILLSLMCFLICSLTIRANDFSGDDFLGGDHPLFPLKRISNSTTNFTYFWISDTPQGQRVTFVWKSKVFKEYLISSVPISLIRLRIDDRCSTPYVKFRWKGSFFNYSASSMDALINENIIYIVLTTNKKDSFLNIEELKLESND